MYIEISTPIGKEGAQIFYVANRRIEQAFLGLSTLKIGDKVFQLKNIPGLDAQMLEEYQNAWCAFKDSNGLMTSTKREANQYIGFMHQFRDISIRLCETDAIKQFLEHNQEPLDVVVLTDIEWEFKKKKNKNKLPKVWFYWYDEHDCHKTLNDALQAAIDDASIELDATILNCKTHTKNHNKD